MEQLNVEELMSALNDDENKVILQLNNQKIKSIKNDVLQQLQLSGSELKSFHKKLKCYRYVDDLENLKFGSYIRWINLTNPNNIKLCNGGFVVKMTMTNGDICITCRNSCNRLFKLCMDNAMIFQKNTKQEEILLNVMDYLNQ
tara:strand:+ start:7559 stop:7987 length:429 start_codon:yes stop_codon:yes gene_type:complete